MQDHDTQRELLKETVSPKKVLEVAKHMEMGPQNQRKINQNFNTTAQLVNGVKNFQGRTTNNLVRNSLATKLFPRTTSLIAFALILVNAGVVTTVKFARQMEKSVIIVLLLGILQRSIESRKSRPPKYQNLHKRMLIRSIQLPRKRDDVESVTSYQQLYDQVHDSNNDSDSNN